MKKTKHTQIHQGVGHEYSHLFSDADRARIKEAVQEAERKTSGEIVPVIVKESDPYYESIFVSALFGLIVASAIALLIIFFGNNASISAKSWDTSHAPTAYLQFVIMLAIQALGIFAGALAATLLPPLKRMLTRPARIEEEVYQRAYEAFLTNNLHHTKENTGVLIFISMLERRVIVLGDKGINEKIKPGFWQNIVDALVAEIKKGSLAHGICEAVSSVGAVLTKTFPSAEDGKNELSNDLRVEE